MLAGVSAERFLADWLQRCPPEGDAFFGLSLGKAGGAMAKSLEDHLGERLIGGFAVTHALEAAQGLSSLWQVHTGSHPRPDESSLQAGQSMVEWIDGLPPDAVVLACLSGGASAILERPRPGFSLSDFQSLLDQSFTEGWTIEILNQERAKRSLFKGGGLAKMLGNRLGAVYCLSDVEPGRLDLLGSGPFWTPETAGLHHIIADRAHVAHLVEEACHKAGLDPVFCGSLSKEISLWLKDDFQPAIASAQPDTACIWTGELTIPLGADPPPGGRCHEAAAWASTLMNPGQACAAFGTDGLDGTSGGAGAVTAPLPEMTPCPLSALPKHDSLGWCRSGGASLPRIFTGSNLNDVVVLVTQ